MWSVCKCVELSEGSAPSPLPYLADWLALTAIETGFLNAVEAHSAWALPSVSIKWIKEDRERKSKKKQTSIGEYTSVAPFWSSLHLFEWLGKMDLSIKGETGCMSML